MTDHGIAGIRTVRLCLSALSLDDAPFILELTNEPSFKRYLGDKGIRSADDSIAYLRDVPLRHYADHGFGLFRVSLIGQDPAVGICGLVSRSEFPAPDLGFAFLRKHWSQGYALEASRAVLAHARGELGLTRVIAMADEGNVASTRLLDKLGFRFERMTRMPGETIEVRQYTFDL